MADGILASLTYQAEAVMTLARVEDFGVHSIINAVKAEAKARGVVAVVAKLGISYDADGLVVAITVIHKLCVVGHLSKAFSAAILNDVAIILVVVVASC